jgi:dTDP-4-dehydrorhamnose reductase
MAKKIIVLGANGMAGHVISIGLTADDAYEVISVARTKSVVNPSVLMDVSDFNSLATLIENTNADVIINCIGLLNVKAEDKPDQAILVNSYLPHFLEAQTKNTNTKVIHISTDCVFSGEMGGYTEKSFKNGIGFYAQSKALGELDNTKDLTFRTSIIGPELNVNGIGLFHWFLNQTGAINGYTNAYWTGITTIELLIAIKQAISENLTGIYHLVNDVKISKYNLVTIFNEVFDKKLAVKQYDGYIVDKSLINTRGDFSFRVKSYEIMISDMKNWIQSNKKLYPHYFSILNSL